MTVESLIVFLIVGAVAGFIAAQITRGAGMGVLANIVVGVLGAFVGTWLLGFLGVSFSHSRVFGISFSGLLGTLVTATLGAIVLLLIVGLFTRGFNRGDRRWGRGSY
jgi:uncharacterized membrane protein YeaQ/YmgE (transglycosylase-associated protein family)